MIHNSNFIQGWFSSGSKSKSTGTHEKVYMKDKKFPLTHFHIPPDVMSCPHLSASTSNLQASHKTVAAKPEPPPTLAPASRSRVSMKTESSDGEDWRNEEDKDETVNGEQLKATSGWNCLPCQTYYPEREVFIAHMAQQHGKVRPLTLTPPPHKMFSYLKSRSR